MKGNYRRNNKEIIEILIPKPDPQVGRHVPDPPSVGQVTHNSLLRTQNSHPKRERKTKGNYQRINKEIIEILIPKPDPTESGQAPELLIRREADTYLKTDNS